jgi:hypothetical protein
MTRKFFAWLPLFALGAVTGCAANPPPASRAAEIERVQCSSGLAADAETRALENATVLQAAPLYSHVITGNNGFEERVDGAKLVIRPPDGISPEQMTRIVQCHSARALLGKVDRAQFPDDPFWLPDTWVSVEVRPENGNYAVILEANDVPTNIRLAARAKAYAENHPLGGASVR